MEQILQLLLLRIGSSPIFTGDTIPIPPPDDTIFGTYTFIARNNFSQGIELTNIHPPGQCSQLRNIIFC